MAIPEHLLVAILQRFPAPGFGAPIRGESEGLECYMRVAGRLWELLGSGQALPYWTADPKKDVRIQELNDIKECIRLWHEFNTSAACNSTKSPAAKKAMGFSDQTLFDTHCCITGFLGVVADLEARHGTGDAKTGKGCLLVARKLCQDALESLFGRMRQALGGKREVSVKDAATMPARLEKKAKAKARRGAVKENKKRLKRQNASVVEDDSDSDDDTTAPAQAAAQAAAGPVWLQGHRILLDHPKLVALHAAAMAAPTAPRLHHLEWRTLRQIQAEDEVSCSRTDRALTAPRLRLACASPAPRLRLACASPRASPVPHLRCARFAPALRPVPALVMQSGALALHGLQEDAVADDGTAHEQDGLLPHEGRPGAENLEHQDGKSAATPTARRVEVGRCRPGVIRADVSAHAQCAVRVPLMSMSMYVHEHVCGTVGMVALQHCTVRVAQRVRRCSFFSHLNSARAVRN